MDDPRQERTRAALGAALLGMLYSSRIDDITVTALCREAGVHRTTFYGHASGIQEFAVEFLTHDIDQVATVEPGHEGMPQRYGRALVLLLAHVAAERPMFRALLNSRWSGALRGALEERLRARVLLALEVFRATGVENVPDELDEVSAFIAGALVGAIDVWAASDDDDAEAGARRLLALMPSWWPVTLS